MRPRTSNPAPRFATSSGGGKTKRTFLFLGTTVAAALILAGGAFASPGGPESVIVGAGDITHCSNLAGAESVAALLDGISGTARVSLTSPPAAL